jgi:hypothetical protein
MSVDGRQRVFAIVIAFWIFAVIVADKSLVENIAGQRAIVEQIDIEEGHSRGASALGVILLLSLLLTVMVDLMLLPLAVDCIVDGLVDRQLSDHCLVIADGWTALRSVALALETLSRTSRRHRR